MLYRVSYVAAYTMVCLAQHSLLLNLLVCGWAVITALSRALMGRHYIGDVVVGLLLGILTTAVVTKVVTCSQALSLSLCKDIRFSTTRSRVSGKQTQKRNDSRSNFLRAKGI